MINDYYLFLDDIRVPEQVKWVKLPTVDWVVVRSYQEFVSAIQANGLPKFISFDHDLADEHYNPSESDYKEKTGYDCAKWLVDYCLYNSSSVCEYTVHSMNPEGKKNIESLLTQFSKYHKP